MALTKMIAAQGDTRRLSTRNRVYVFVLAYSENGPYKVYFYMKAKKFSVQIQGIKIGPRPFYLHIVL